jgi:hypothetical protein
MQLSQSETPNRAPSSVLCIASLLHLDFAVYVIKTFD